LAASTVSRDRNPAVTPSPGQQVQAVDDAASGNRLEVAFWEWRPNDPTPSERDHIPGDGDVGNANPPPPPVLLLHGSPGAGAAFRGVGPALGRNRRAIAPDLPGFGASTRRLDDYSIASHAGQMLALLDSLGVGSTHLVGFSMGGGVALEMYRRDPDRIESVTLLSAIGVQEFELLGDYHLNHAIHGLQLFGLWALTELVPHFGLLDGGFLGHSYARNFYDTDQRPLRGILESFEPPMLILHGDEDPLVPAGAAREHARIVPQAELAMIPGDHFMTFMEPDRIHLPIGRFLDQVDEGGGVTRSRAPPARRATAQQPFDPEARPPASGFALVVTLALIAAATFVSEDLTCIGTGLLVARGSLPWFPGMLACLIGIWVGDLLLYGAGRFIGRPVVRVAPLRWLIDAETLERACDWFTERTGPLVLWGRFLPGTRLPSYVAAGVVRVPVAGFGFWALVAGILWTPLLVGGTALFGIAAASWIGAFQDRAIVWLLGTGFLALLALRIGVPLLSRRGRRAWTARLGRLRRWEFWPPALFYMPVAAYVAWLAIRHRSLTVFTAANPAIPDGGFVGESKGEILSFVSDRRVAAFRLLPAGGDRVNEGLAAGDTLGYPLVAKPDVGERGAGVEIVPNREALRARLESDDAALLLQEYVPGVELGVFYYRMPGHESGTLLGVTEKRLPKVTGDGRRTVEELVFSDKRLRCQWPVFERRLGTDLQRVPTEGEVVHLGRLGNHCLGCEFRDGTAMTTEGLTTAVDEVARSFPGFYFGRMDVRGPSVGAMNRGDFKVIEINGVSSEATHIYDPDHSLLTAYRVLFEQWRLAFQIGERNRTLGVEPTSLTRLLGGLGRHFRPGGARWIGPADTGTAVV
ncbi:MAG: alpha/beta fold hydrolase, partial [Gemmatimonadetes bacterium]|nr:alpha/beta fold hydrolase [Gemmatimonadota bacterium]